MWRVEHGPLVLQGAAVGGAFGEEGGDFVALLPMPKLPMVPC